MEAYLACWRNIEAVSGQAFNLGGGPANAVSLRQVISCIEDVVGHEVETVASGWRAGDQRYYVSDTSRAMHALDLQRPTPWREGLARLADWLRQDRGEPGSRSAEAAE